LDLRSLTKRQYGKLQRTAADRRRLVDWPLHLLIAVSREPGGGLGLLAACPHGCTVCDNHARPPAGDAHQYFMTHASLSGCGGHAHGEEAEGSNGGGRAHSAAHYSAAGGTDGEVGEDDARLRHLSAFLDGEGMDV
jgi:hypothetical protein